jgi:hypothetical protein
MTDARLLLERHRPRLAYDSIEVYFADSAATWTDSPANVLRRPDGSVLARPPQLSLSLLGPHAYADGRRVLADDAIGETTRDYAAHAAALHRQPRYRDRVYGHARRDRAGRLWLQYWLFYYYNDFQLLGPLVSGGKHEGDWELVQIRLGAGERPEQAVYTQHKTAESRPWSDVRKPSGAPNTPVVYVARGSHANYFRPGSHWTGVWFDQADGRGPAITPALEILGDSKPAWVHWPGWWGDTKSSGPIDSSSPRSPGRRPHWSDPAALVMTPRRLGVPPPLPPAPPRVEAWREGDRVVVECEGPMVVGVRDRPGEPARTWQFEGPRGEIVSDAREIWVSAGGSASVRAAVRPANGRH